LADRRRKRLPISCCFLVCDYHMHST
jgi:hypothetical protein